MNDTIPTSEVLNRAADLIEDRGWGQGDESWDGATLCIEGGIMAALGIKIDDRWELWACPGYQAVADYLSLPTFPTLTSGEPASREMWTWNDDEDRTAAEVIETLRACAVIEASRESQPARVSA